MQSLGQDNKIIVLLQIMMIEINMEERGSGDCHGKEKIYMSSKQGGHVSWN